jgi:heme-degrading monooxygenase HmoA
MHAEVVFIQLHPHADKDEALRVFRDEVLPEVEQLPGHKNGLLLANWALGKLIFIMLWETQAHGQDAREKGHYDRLIGKAFRYFSASPLLEEYEVVFQDVDPGKATGYARFIYYEVNPSFDYDEGLRVWQDEATPADRQQPGYKGNLVMGDRATGRGIVVALWETKADLEASEASGHYQRQAHRFMHVLKTPPIREVYEVAAHNVD